MWWTYGITKMPSQLLTTMREHLINGKTFTGRRGARGLTIGWHSWGRRDASTGREAREEGSGKAADKTEDRGDGRAKQE